MYSRIELTLAASPRAGLVAAGPWLLLLAAAVALAAAVHPMILVTVPVLISGGISRWRRCGSQRHPQAVIKLTVNQKNLFATLADGRELQVSVASDSRVGGEWLVLTLRAVEPRQDLPVVLAPGPGPGNADTTALRRLRVWLRLMPDAATPIQSTPWYRNPLQALRPGGNPNVRDAR
ncbi:hypothetical protein SAMN05216203_2749 [Marinobacter daqiaonensis]|uniref:Toxin CptA n=1 Tax=Marinobacter daqiaonensis TaxID=650891 RepID=A0A1I6J7Q9_9GAMM|nr:hypothetical protein [Marinobacter daqiaonensis]SFR74967.1 hypothetical protein SAMN05216203_2749 [Marinobacter daqiaonensis]